MVRQPGGTSADGARSGSVLGSRVLLPRSPRQSGQAVVPIRQAPRTAGTSDAKRSI